MERRAGRPHGSTSIERVRRDQSTNRRAHELWTRWRVVESGWIATRGPHAPDRTRNSGPNQPSRSSIAQAIRSADPMQHRPAVGEGSGRFPDMGKLWDAHCEPRLQPGAATRLRSRDAGRRPGCAAGEGPMTIPPIQGVVTTSIAKNPQRLIGQPWSLLPQERASHAYVRISFLVVTAARHSSQARCSDNLDQAPRHQRTPAPRQALEEAPRPTRRQLGAAQLRDHRRRSSSITNAADSQTDSQWVIRTATLQPTPADCFRRREAMWP
jgi:hypothetical protein